MRVQYELRHSNPSPAKIRHVLLAEGAALRDRSRTLGRELRAQKMTVCTAAYRQRRAVAMSLASAHHREPRPVCETVVLNRAGNAARFAAFACRARRTSGPASNTRHGRLPSVPPLTHSRLSSMLDDEARRLYAARHFLSTCATAWFQCARQIDAPETHGTASPSNDASA